MSSSKDVSIRAAKRRRNEGKRGPRKGQGGRPSAGTVRLNCKISESADATIRANATAASQEIGAYLSAHFGGQNS